MKQYLKAYLLPCTILLQILVLSACTQEQIPTPTAQVHYSLESFSLSRVQRNGDWRDAYQLPSGVHEFHFTAQDEAQLRLSFSAKGVSKNPIRVEIFSGDQRIDEVQNSTPDSWVDHVSDLKAVDTSKQIRVRFHADVSFYITQCDTTPPASTRPNMLVFLIDTLRRDHLGCYDYERATSPHIDALAKEGIVFDHLISQASWTRPAVASLLTGTYPTVHGAKDRADILRQDLPTLTDAFQEQDYRTQGFMSNPTCLPMWGFGNGFQRYADIDSYNIRPQIDQDVCEAVLDSIDHVAGDPWLLYVHLIGPHEPYEAPAPYDHHYSGTAPGYEGLDEEQMAIVNGYDGEILFTDLQISRVLEAMKERGLYDNTTIVVTSDHGEQFWEHGERGHGLTLHDEEIRVPLIMKLPGQKHAGKRIEEMVELVDLGPTILDLAEIPIPDTFQGRSLLGLIEEAPFEVRPAYASLYLEKKSMYGTRNQQLKYIHDLSTSQSQWFNLIEDPEEAHPLPSPPEGGDALLQRSTRVNASGGAGLYIMVTGSLLEKHDIRGTILSDNNIGPHHLRYEAQNGEVQAKEKQLDFRITTSLGSRAPRDLAQWHEHSAEQNHALLKVAIDPSTPITLSITLDGEPAPAAMCFLGQDQTPTDLTTAQLEPMALLGDPAHFSPMALPRRLAVYCWYVPDVDSIDDDDLDQDMADALETLGYL